MPFSLASRLMYALVNGESRSTSVGPMPARSAANTAVMAWSRASWCEAPVSSYRCVALTRSRPSAVM